MSHHSAAASKALRTDYYQDRYGLENPNDTRAPATNYEDALGDPATESFPSEGQEQDANYSIQYRRMARGETGQNHGHPSAGLDDLDAIDQQMQQADADQNAPSNVSPIDDLNNIDAQTFKDEVDQLKSEIAATLQADHVLDQAGHRALLNKYTRKLDKLVHDLSHHPMTEDQASEALDKLKNDFQKELNHSSETLNTEHETERSSLKTRLSSALDALVNMPDSSHYLAFSDIGKNGHWEGLANLLFDPLGPVVNIVAEINKQDNKEWTSDETRQLARAMKSALANDDWSAFNDQLSKLSSNGASRVVKNFVDAFTAAGQDTDQLLNLIPPQTRREMLSASMNLGTDLNDTQIAGNSTDIISRSLSEENLQKYRYLYENGRAASLTDLSIPPANREGAAPQ